jgi:hypothetical protein
MLTILMVGIKNILFTGGLSLFLGIYSLYNIFHYVRKMEDDNSVFSTKYTNELYELQHKYNELQFKYDELQEKYNILEKKYTSLTTCPSQDSLVFSHSSNNSLSIIQEEELEETKEPESVDIEFGNIYEESNEPKMFNMSLDAHIVLEENKLMLKGSTNSIKELMEIFNDDTTDGIQIYKESKAEKKEIVSDSFHLVEPNKIIPMPAQQPVTVDQIDWVRVGMHMFFGTK